MLQVFYLDVAYVSVAIYICYKRPFNNVPSVSDYVASVLSGCCICCCYTHMLQMYHLFQTYVAGILHVTTLAGAWSGRTRRRFPRARQAKQAWVVPTCMRTSRHEAHNYSVGAPACGGGCAGATVAYGGECARTAVACGAGLAACMTGCGGSRKNQSWPILVG